LDNEAKLVQIHIISVMDVRFVFGEHVIHLGSRDRILL